MSRLSEEMPKRSVNVVFYEMPKSDLYPDGKMYMVRMVRIKRSGDAERVMVSTEKLSHALDMAEQFLETGAVTGEYPKA